MSASKLGETRCGDDVLKGVDLSGTGNDAYLVDDNENNIWNGGGAGNDLTYFLAPGAGPGTPFSCDCDGNGTIEIGKYLSSGSSLFMDLDNFKIVNMSYNSFFPGEEELMIFYDLYSLISFHRNERF